ncbi:pyruvate kinase PKM, partial [Nephila pilipes]
TAHLISKYRPRCPILCVTREAVTARQAQVYRAIIAIHFTDEKKSDFMEDVKTRIDYAINFGKKKEILSNGNIIITVTGSRPGKGGTDTIRVINVQ